MFHVTILYLFIGGSRTTIAFLFTLLLRRDNKSYTQIYRLFIVIKTSIINVIIILIPELYDVLVLPFVSRLGLLIACFGHVYVLPTSTFYLMAFTHYIFLRCNLTYNINTSKLICSYLSLLNLNSNY